MNVIQYKSFDINNTLCAGVFVISYTTQSKKTLRRYFFQCYVDPFSIFLIITDFLSLGIDCAASVTGTAEFAGNWSGFVQLERVTPAAPTEEVQRLERKKVQNLDRKQHGLQIILLRSLQHCSGCWRLFYPLRYLLFLWQRNTFLDRKDFAVSTQLKLQLHQQLANVSQSQYQKQKQKRAILKVIETIFYEMCTVYIALPFLSIC